MSHKLILNTGFMVNRFNDYEKFFSLLKSVNIDNIQLTVSLFNYNLNNKDYFKQIDNFKKKSFINNIKVSSIFTDSFTRLNHLSNINKNISDFWYEKFKIFIKTASILEAENFGSHLGIVDMNVSKKIQSNILTKTIKKWTKLSNFALKCGLKSLSWEPMSVGREFGETIYKTKKINNLLNQNSSLPIKICLDVDHGDKQKNYYNANPYNWIQELAKHSYCLHLKQVKKNYHSSHLCFTKKNNKSGIIKANKIINILETLNLNNMNLVLEHSFKERSSVENNLISDLKESIKYWKDNI
tara:strand:+ start:232 stop:1125 length:894 start_codon:yes stop_codon:yes gene_type:complete